MDVRRITKWHWRRLAPGYIGWIIAHVIVVTFFKECGQERGRLLPLVVRGVGWTEAPKYPMLFFFCLFRIPKTDWRCTTVVFVSSLSVVTISDVEGATALAATISLDRGKMLLGVWVRCISALVGSCFFFPLS